MTSLSYLMRYKYQVFRFITPIFLHAGFLHIIFNLWAQLRFGLYLEREWGILRTIVIYFVSGIAGMLLASLKHILIEIRQYFQFSCSTTYYQCRSLWCNNGIEDRIILQ